MNALVNWNRDIEETKLLDLFRVEYERCNIWPDRDYSLRDYEGQISGTASVALWYVKSISEKNEKEGLKEDSGAEIIRANAIEAACQAIKVIAVCNKWLSKYSEVSYDTIKK